MSEGRWFLDRVHYASPVPHLYAELFPKAIAEGSRPSYRRYGMLTDGLSYRFVDGFGYFSAPLLTAPDELAHRCAQAEESFATRRWRGDVRAWREEVRPAAVRSHLALLEITEEVASSDPSYIERCMAHLQAAVAQHHRFNPTVAVPLGDFVAHASDWTGCSPIDAFEVLAGHSPISVGASEVVIEAARAVDGDAAARKVLNSDEPPRVVLDRLTSLAGQVGARVDRFLVHEGHRLVGGFDLGCRTALEVPQVLVELLRAALNPPTASRPRVSAAELRSQVPGLHVAAFDRLFEDAVLCAPLRDERGIYSDTWAGGILRRAVLAAGRRLEVSGFLEAAEHLLEARPVELLAMVAGEGRPLGGELAARAAARRAAACAEPPTTLGDGDTPSLDVVNLPPALQRMWRAMRPAVPVTNSMPAEEPHVVSGVGVGSVPYAGRARVIADLADLGSVEPGDILVTITTTESLNVVGALIGGLVTENGGPLSHAAITAREWGIPAVVGCEGATRRIPDGAPIRIDPQAGRVTIGPGP